MIDILLVLSVMAFLSITLLLRHFSRLEETTEQVNVQIHPDAHVELLDRAKTTRWFWQWPPQMGYLEMKKKKKITIVTEEYGSPKGIYKVPNGDDEPKGEVEIGEVEIGEKVDDGPELFFPMEDDDGPLMDDADGPKGGSLMEDVDGPLMDDAEGPKGVSHGGPLMDDDAAAKVSQTTKLLGYVGRANISTRVYESDSRNISITFQRHFFTDQADSPLTVTDTVSGKSIELQFPKEAEAAAEFLEIELLSAALTVAGEKKQRQHLSAQTLNFCWNCHFAKSGDQVVTFIIRLVSPLDQIQLGSVEHHIKVVKVDHLTQRQVWLITRVTAVLSGIFALAEILRRLGAW